MRFSSVPSSPATGSVATNASPQGCGGVLEHSGDASRRHQTVRESPEPSSRNTICRLTPMLSRKFAANFSASSIVSAPPFSFAATRSINSACRFRLSLLVKRASSMSVGDLRSARTLPERATPQPHFQFQHRRMARAAAAGNVHASRFQQALQLRRRDFRRLRHGQRQQPRRSACLHCAAQNEDAPFRVSRQRQLCIRRFLGYRARFVAHRVRSRPRSPRQPAPARRLPLRPYARRSEFSFTAIAETAAP